MSWYSFVFVAKVEALVPYIEFPHSLIADRPPGVACQASWIKWPECRPNREVFTHRRFFAKQMRNNLNLMSLGSCMCAFAQVFCWSLAFCAMLRYVSLPFQSKRAQSPLVGSPQLLGLGGHARTLRPCGLLRDDTSMAWCPPFRLWYRCKCDSDTMWHR